MRQLIRSGQQKQNNYHVNNVTSHACKLKLISVIRYKSSLLWSVYTFGQSNFV